MSNYLVNEIKFNSSEIKGPIVMNKMTCVTELMHATVILAVSCLYKSRTQNT
jgi:hypothetical protein